MTPRQRKAAAEALRVLADVLETEEASKPAPAPADAAEFVEVARAGIPPKTCRRLIKAGALPAFKVGRALCVRRADVRAWVEAQRVEQVAPRAAEAPRPAKAAADPVERLIAAGRLRRAGREPAHSAAVVPAGGTRR